MDAAKKVALDLRALRISEGLSQAELSKISGYTQMTVSTIETGRREPKIVTVERLADVMGYDLEIKFNKR